MLSSNSPARWSGCTAARLRQETTRKTYDYRDQLLEGLLLLSQMRCNL